MNGVDPNSAHLVLQADVDGEAVDAQALAAASDAPEAGRVREELERINEAFAGLPELEPPQGLVDDILAALPQPVQPGSRRSQRFTLFGWLVPAPLGFAFAFLGGLAVGIGALQLASNFPVDHNGMTATLTPPDAAPPLARTVDRQRLELSSLSGTFDLHQAGSELYLEFAGVSRRPLELELDLGAGPVAFRAFGQPTGEPPAVTLAPGRITIGLDGHREFMLSLQHQGGREVKIPIRVLADGSLLREVALTAQPVASSP